MPGASVEGLFSDLQKELSSHTPLEKELAIIVQEARTYLESELQRGEGRGVRLFEDLLAWLQSTQQPRSLGPLAVVALRHPSSGQEIVILGTPHCVAGLSADENPIPGAVARAIARLKPDLVAVELDAVRGTHEFEKLPAQLRGRSPVFLPEEEPAETPSEPGDLLGGLQGFFGGSSHAELGVDEDLLQRVEASFGREGKSARGYIRALREIFTDSSDSCLAMNALSLDEFRFQDEGDWGRDATAAVRAAAKAELPVLLCDLPQEWTLSRVVPVYNRAWVEAKERRLSFLGDEERAASYLQAEEKIVREAILERHGGDLPTLDYGLGLCRPAVGFAEAETRSLWLEERDPVMAKAVVAALQGRVRSTTGGEASLPKLKRAALQVGHCHVEGIAKQLVSRHGFEVVRAPEGGWKGSADASAGKPRKPKSRAAGFSQKPKAKRRK
eukprot:TRINITY_DN95910_c0_g1_i1.p1 TRINITY_DN95910_c0_g1~~TRINITY_DN95910_c0_g1_i1.p1  ORF type:complete len:509 (-),score=120.13 TRINITY_DN95910_c0_g1_i1:9-1337(-)